MCLYLYSPDNEHALTILFANEGITFKSPVRSEAVVDILIKNTTGGDLKRLLVIYPRSFSRLIKDPPPSSLTRIDILPPEESFEFNRSLGDPNEQFNRAYHDASGFRDFEEAILLDDDFIAQNPEAREVDITKYYIKHKSFGHYDFSDTELSDAYINEYRTIL